MANRLAEQILGGLASTGDIVRVVPDGGGRLALETMPSGAESSEDVPDAALAEA